MDDEERFSSYSYGEARTGNGQVVEFSYPTTSSREEIASFIKTHVRDIDLPATRQVNVGHGGYGQYSRFNIKQHKYAGGGPGEGGGWGYIEVLEIQNPPNEKLGIVINERTSRDGGTFTEWDTLETHSLPLKRIGAEVRRKRGYRSASASDDAWTADCSDRGSTPSAMNSFSATTLSLKGCRTMKCTAWARSLSCTTTTACQSSKLAWGRVVSRSLVIAGGPVATKMSAIASYSGMTARCGMKIILQERTLDMPKKANSGSQKRRNSSGSFSPVGQTSSSSASQMEINSSAGWYNPTVHVYVPKDGTRSSCISKMGRKKKVGLTSHRPASTRTSYNT